MTVQQNGGQALVAALHAHGVDTVFGIPGTHNLSAFAALPEFGIRTVLTRHEQAPATRPTGTPGSAAGPACA
ncbi:MAG TPA: thiamine pyrophosphate-binding protein [Pseudonocardia sp.]|nr:thiamine pyrophosphate-binding protein [Pseudonocardia sp.]